MGSLGMFFYVVECFSVNLENFATDAVGSAQFGGIDQEIECQGRFVAIALGKAAHEVHEVGGLDTHGLEIGNKGAEVAALVANGLLEVAEAAGGLVGSDRNLALEHVE